MNKGPVWLLLEMEIFCNNVNICIAPFNLNALKVCAKKALKVYVQKN